MVLRSLRSLTLAFLCLFLAITTLSGFALHSATQVTLHRLADERIASVSALLAPKEAPSGQQDIARRIAELSSTRDTGDLGMVLTDRAGRKLAGNVRLIRQLPPGYSFMTVDDRIQGLTNGRALVRDIGNGLRLTVFAETEPFNNYYAARVRIYLITFGAIIAVVLGGLLLFRRMIGQRIVNMRRTVDAIIDGDLKQRVPVNGTGDEFDQQAEGFNRMLDRISELMAAVRNVTNDISHELRTPLARLRSQLALLEHRNDAVAVRSELRDAIEQADQSLAMFSAILRIAEVESGSRRAGFASLSLDILVGEVTDMMGAVAQESGHSLSLNQCAPARITGDKQLLTQMAINLIENALRHTPGGTSIELSIVEEVDGVAFSVRDNGPGIPADNRAQVMRRFGRLEQSQRRSGHGLGLPLVDAIVRMHGGWMQLADAQPGLIVNIFLPFHP